MPAIVPTKVSTAVQTQPPQQEINADVQGAMPQSPRCRRTVTNRRFLMLRSDSVSDWSRLMLDASRLWVDASTVVALRSWRLMGGGASAQREFRRMVGEKVEAGFELAGALASGRATSPKGAARKALAVTGKRVRANRRRLG